MCPRSSFLFFFFFNDTATTEIYTLSLHDALPISGDGMDRVAVLAVDLLDLLDSYERRGRPENRGDREDLPPRSEEHTSELQSRENLVCRLLLEKKKKYGRECAALEVMRTVGRWSQ